MKFSKEVKEQRNNELKTINYMGGVSYKVTPLVQLQLVTASSIFGEPKYYQNNKCEKHIIPNILNNKVLFVEFNNLTTIGIFEKTIDNALDFDFKATLEWAVVLRNEFYMRLNPQVILVRAMLHPKRVNFNKNNPNFVRTIAKEIIKRGDEPASQLTYFLYINKSKKNLPTILKKVWRDKLNKLNEYEINKYKKSHIGIIDTVRICHANSIGISKLMNNNFNKSVKNTTWKNLRSAKDSWYTIFSQKKLGHMALLTNLRGIAKEITSKKQIEEVLQVLEDGVIKGKLFPFRYYQAVKIISNEEITNKSIIIESLERCMDIALSNLPILKGKTVCLSDNSGSCWGTLTTENGSNTISEINNLSSVITACNSEDGEVVKFGDNMISFPVTKRRGVLYQTQNISDNIAHEVGQETEHGIWLFFKKAISNKIHYDNIFIYSDQQAGHGKLYGLNPSTYIEFSHERHYFDIPKLIEHYRQFVNNKVNVYSVQTAGYSNCLIPEYLYRTAILTGWTGKELLFAHKINEIWENI